MLDHEVGVDEIEARVVERQRLVEVGREKLVEVRVRTPCLFVRIDPDEPSDAVAIVA